jgi:ATP-binding cassette subfamily C protein CydC
VTTNQMTTMTSAGQDALRRAIRLLALDGWRLARSVALGIACLAASVLLAAVSAWLIARASQQPGPAALGLAAVGVRAAGVGRGVFRYLERLSSHDVALRGMATLREQVYRQLADADAAVLFGLRRGDLLARVGADVEAVGDLVVRSLLPSLVALGLGVLSVAGMAYLHPPTALALAACLILAGVVAPWLTARGAAVAEQDGVAARADLAAAALTALDDPDQLRLAGHDVKVLANVSAANRRIWAATDAGARWSALGAALGQVALGAAVLAAIWLAVPAAVAGSVSPTGLAVVVLTPLAAFEATSVLPTAAVQLRRSTQAAVRVMALLDAGAHPASTAPASAEPSSSPAPALTARNLVVGWTDPLTDEINLDLELGHLVAVVGPSGIGKTTLLATLAELLPPLSGSVSITSKVILTTEDAHVFNTTILENLRVGDPGLTSDQAVDLLTRVGLGPWLDALPDSVDTMLGADAQTISGGERRRLLLARALASAAPLLLIDEPAEHLDPISADSLIADLATIARTQGRAILIVTHRRQGLAVADKVVVLDRVGDRATVVAQGRHLDLLATNEAYRTVTDQEGA